ncbi:MAG: selenide, water dikinase SelD, partial [Pseudonocardia sp.]
VWVAAWVDAGPVAVLDVLLLADAQTSGVLLFGAAPYAAAAAVTALGGAAAVIGTVTAGTGRITLR